MRQWIVRGEGTGTNAEEGLQPGRNLPGDLQTEQGIAIILGGALPAQIWVHLVGLASLWIAAALTLVTGYDYLRTGLKHFD